MPATALHQQLRGELVGRAFAAPVIARGVAVLGARPKVNMEAIVVA